MMDNLDEKDQEEITRKVVSDCLKAISEGDSDAGLNMAHHFLADIPSEYAFVPVAVIEALIMQSAQLGSENAQEFLKDTWPAMKPIVIKRLERRGLK